MSVYVLVVSIALGGQVVSDDRYGPPPGQPASAGGQSASPQSTAPASRISPPPPFDPAARTVSPVTPGEPSSALPAQRPSAPPAAARIDETPSDAAVNSKPSTMIRRILTAPPDSRLSGRPVRLAEVLAGATNRGEQSLRIAAYWDLCSSVADFYLAVRERQELQQLQPSATNIGPAWQQAQTDLGVRIGTAQRAAVATQYRLESLIGGFGEASLPLPADVPHCGDYFARYDQVFAGRPLAEARELSELLPMRYAELCDAAAAVTRAEESLNAVAARRADGDGVGTLRALELLALRRRAFVEIACDYNRRIARYAELASPGDIDNERLIGMLIMREGAANTAKRPATLVPPPNRQSLSPAEEPAATFADGWESIKSAAADGPRDDAVQPASAESPRSKPRREHSLLVPTQ